MGSREDVAAKIEADTVLKIEEMNRSISVNKEALLSEILAIVYDIKPEVHKNFQIRGKQY
jgi:V-type H+-transporting ATPase subunit G